MDTPETKPASTALDELCQLDTIIRNCAAGLQQADRLKCQGRWQPKWDAELQALQARHDDAQRERTALDRMIARTIAASPL